MKEILMFLEMNPLMAAILAAILTAGVMSGTITISWINIKGKKQKTTSREELKKEIIEELKEELQDTGNEKLTVAVVLLMINTAVEATAEKLQIRLKETLSEQMAAGELAIAEIKNIMKRSYLKLTKLHTGQSTGILDEKDVQHYEDILDAMEKVNIDWIRKWMKDNHFIFKTEEEFSGYVDGKFKFLNDLNSDILDDRYKTRMFQIPRETLYKSNMEHIAPEAEKILRKFFYKARDIGREKDEKLTKLEKELRDINRFKIGDDKDV